MHKIARENREHFPISRGYRLHLCQRMGEHNEKKINNNTFEYTCNMFNVQFPSTKNRTRERERAIRWKDKKKMNQQKSFLARKSVVKLQNFKNVLLFCTSMAGINSLEHEKIYGKDTKPNQMI